MINVTVFPPTGVPSTQREEELARVGSLGVVVAGLMALLILAL